MIVNNVCTLSEKLCKDNVDENDLWKTIKISRRLQIYMLIECAAILLAACFCGSLSMETARSKSFPVYAYCKGPKITLHNGRSQDTTKKLVRWSILNIFANMYKYKDIFVYCAYFL